MAIIRNIAHKVFRCFWRIERWADHLTGKAGPVFITLAVLLILMAIITYFDVIFPLSFLREETEPWKSMIALIFSLYLTACCTIHYYHACSIPPGSPSEPINSQLRSNHIGSNYQHRSFLSCPRTLRRWWSPKPHRIGSIKQEMIEQYRSNLNNHYCKKCLRNGIKGIDGRGPIKPERAHHCRICGICQLKYDHHFYMTISSAWIVVWGWTAFNASLNFTIDWPFWSPRIFVVLTWILALAIGVTIGIMFGWQLLLIIRGETTVESSDNEYYRKLFSLRGETYINPYNLGIRMNLEQFFNVGSEGKSRWYKIFLPIKISPSSDGWKWIKRPGYEHQIIDQNDQLTDQDDDLAPSSA